MDYISRFNLADLDYTTKQLDHYYFNKQRTVIILWRRGIESSISPTIFICASKEILICIIQ